MAKSLEEMAQSMIDNLEAKTGRPLDAWLTAVGGSGKAKHGEIVRWLKDEHSVTHGYANLIAHKALERGSSPAGADALVEAQYAGAKAGLRPIYEALLGAVAKLGDDVEIAPKKGYVSLRRRKQFALIQPSTRTRIDLGLNLGDVKPSGRLEPSGSFNAMVSHRVRLESADEVDDGLTGWLKKAYERA